MPATPAWPPKSLPRLFVRAELAEGARVDLDAGQANYLGNVMRLGEGGEVLLFDGSSGEWLGRIAEAGKKRMLPYQRTAEGIAVITVTGTLINRGAWVGASSGETSYEGIKYQVAAATADPRARAIIIDIESPGGEAVGAFEAADVIRQAAKVKPVVAVVNGMMASAAYALGSAATKIVTTPTGLSGSIGVVMLHAAISWEIACPFIATTVFVLLVEAWKLAKRVYFRRRAAKHPENNDEDGMTGIFSAWKTMEVSNGNTRDLTNA